MIVEILVLVILIVGIIASVTPIPGGLVSLVGVLLYWWSTGYSEPSLLVFSFLVIICILTVFVDFFSGFVSAKVGGASNRSIAFSAIFGLVGLLSLGPIGMISFLSISIFALEYYRTRNSRESLKASIYSLIGIFSSAIIQALLTFSVLLSMILVIIF